MARRKGEKRVEAKADAEAIVTAPLVDLDPVMGVAPPIRLVPPMGPPGGVEGMRFPVYLDGPDGRRLRIDRPYWLAHKDACDFSVLVERPGEPGVHHVLHLDGVFARLRDSTQFLPAWREAAGRLFMTESPARVDIDAFGKVTVEPLVRTVTLPVSVPLLDPVPDPGEPGSLATLERWIAPDLGDGYLYLTRANKGDLVRFCCFAEAILPGDWWLAEIDLRQGFPIGGHGAAEPGHYRAYGMTPEQAAANLLSQVRERRAHVCPVEGAV